LALIRLKLGQLWEPVYQARTIGQWIKQPFPDGEWQKCHEMAQALGTNALPALIQLAGTRESKLKWALRQIRSRLPFSIQRCLPMSVEGYEACDRAAYALGLLGADVAPAVLTLIRVLEDGIGADNVVIPLGLIGPPASNAVTEPQRLAGRPHGHFPACFALLKIGTTALPTFDILDRHASKYIRLAGRAGGLLFTGQTNEALATLVAASRDDAHFFYALHYFVALGGAAVPAIPEMARVLQHSDERIRQYCAEALSAFGPSAVHTLDPLSTAVSVEVVPDAGIAKIRAIGAIGSAASGLRPILEQFLQASDEETMAAAREALERILPKKH